MYCGYFQHGCGCQNCGCCQQQPPPPPPPRPPLSQLCCYQNCLSQNPPLNEPTTKTQTPQTPPTRSSDESVPPPRPTKQPRLPPPPPPPPVEEPVAVPEEEPIEIPVEENVFHDTLEATDELLEAPFEEDPIPIIDDKTFTPEASFANMKSHGGSQAPMGNPIPWDGKILPWRNKTKSQLCQMFFPEGNANLVGLHDLYNKIRPFADENAPTVAEIDRWNLEVLRHFRRLIGNTAPFEYDQNLMLQARWSDERKYSTKWDAAYPTTTVGGSGPCPAGSGAHCGWTFVPNCMDQQSYLDQYPGMECITKPLGNGGHAEGIGGVKNDVPWANKVAHVLKLFLCQDGTEFHMGPIFGNEFGGVGVNYKSGRTTVGISFWDKGNGSTSVRFKWGGKV